MIFRLKDTVRVWVWQTKGGPNLGSAIQQMYKWAKPMIVYGETMATST